MTAILLWFVGALFLGLAPFITSNNGEGVARVARLIVILIGALCWRFA